MACKISFKLLSVFCDYTLVVIGLSYFICWQQPLVKVVNQSSASCLATIWQKHVFFLLHLSWSPWFLLSGCDHFIISFFPGPKGRYTSLTNTMKKWVNKKRYKCNWKYFYRAPFGMWNRCHQLWRDRCVLILKLLILLYRNKKGNTFIFYFHTCYVKMITFIPYLRVSNGIKGHFNMFHIDNFIFSGQNK